MMLALGRQCLFPFSPVWDDRMREFPSPALQAKYRDNERTGGEKKRTHGRCLAYAISVYRRRNVLEEENTRGDE